ncbi:PDZ domain-containing protein [Sphingomonas koreensis]|jgi:general secretion pathway protein C|uniref:PDZ domain-containing protein n=1 Tax=Sphingomonas koreensis TaxID=93064 RepID=A0A1L6JD35_9SPHN|nr:type II secretion system protein N [Sphingomonas koreensis]APR53832.1 signaling protein [Sphingomonas koreensis]MDC7808692.1 type II secretion system protein N [Sphingomonas koreensis]RSU17250.1 PDZ domain-containing protein [Sphingomonas koreensis]RSU21145.1 PDZ domain-containing protein [Sphingomonas koreensis]RSU23193.1 PDZ domain-containing protein [Sphingomonas koreensis]
MIRLPDLSPRQARTTLDIATAAVVVSVAIALAGLTWRIAGHASSGAVTLPSGVRSAAAPADVTAALAFAPFGKGAVTDASQATALPLKLKGVFAASPADLSVAYIEVGGEPAKAFRVGEAPGGGTIEGILRDRVLLRVNGRIEYLAFPDPTLTVEQQAQAAAGPSQPTTAQPSPNTPPAPSALMSSLTPVPGGVQIGSNAPPGLQQGDVITSVNGQAISSQASAASALAAAQSRGTAQIQITRDGKPVTLTVPTR